MRERPTVYLAGPVKERDDPDWSAYQELRDAEADEVFVYVAPESTSPVYHTDRECRQLEDDADPRAQADLPERFRECTRCRYDGVPALEDTDAGGDAGGGAGAAARDRAALAVDPVTGVCLLVGLAAVWIVATLFVAVVGGLL